MGSRTLVYLLFVVAIATVDCNFEGDILYAWKNKLVDPNNVLESWNPKLENPCTWFHVTCDTQNRVTRLDLENAGLSGPIIPQLGLLENLQYLEIAWNNISGSIPAAVGNLTRLISLDLFHNQLSGPIPASLGNMQSLRFMRVNSNKLSGHLPIEVISLVLTGDLRILNVSDNTLAGTVRSYSPEGFTTTTIIQDPKAPPK